MLFLDLHSFILCLCTSPIGSFPLVGGTFKKTSYRKQATMSGKPEDVSIIKKMERDRRGKPIMSLTERIRILEEIYDGGLIWMQQAVMTGQFKGSGAASHVVERARLELTDLRRTSNMIAERDTGITIGFELPDLETSTDEPTVKA